MGFRELYWAVCDQCGKRSTQFDEPEALDRELTERGWTYLQEPNLIICPARVCKASVAQ